MNNKIEWFESATNFFTGEDVASRFTVCFKDIYNGWGFNIERIAFTYHDFYLIVKDVNWKLHPLFGVNRYKTIIDAKHGADLILSLIKEEYKYVTFEEEKDKNFKFFKISEWQYVKYINNSLYIVSRLCDSVYTFDTPVWWWECIKITNKTKQERIGKFYDTPEECFTICKEDLINK